MYGTGIMVSSHPRGVFLEGKASGTLKPGMIVQIKATDLVSGRPVFEKYNRDADGNRPQGPFFVVLEDTLQGKTYSDSYSDGDRVFVYAPLPGEELNVLWSAAGTGTGDSVAIGDLAIPDDGTGLLITTTGTPECEPFMAMEAVSDVTAEGTLVRCMFTGY